ncbi:MAG: extracellular solute-binding protein [Ruminiclostridium sp.]|nr:extracellular solute-binding protein [Ruminiclostridium sp.]
MKKQKKVLSALLALTMLSGTASCAGERANGADGTSQAVVTTTMATTADSNKALDTEVNYNEMANIGEVDTANEEGTGPAYTPGQKAGHIKALCYYDIAADQPEITTIFAERYGGTIETEITTSMGYFEKLGTLIAAGLSPDLVRYDWAAYPDGVSKNIYTPLDEWLDIESPLWSDMAPVIESFSYQGKHYYFPQNTQANFAIIYNRALIEEENLPDPMDLYFAGEWDWNAFEDILYKWSQKGEDYIGFTGGSWSSLMFINTTGTQVIEVTDDDIVNNLRNQDLNRCMEWLEGLRRQGLLGKGYIHPGDAFKDGKLLFMGQLFTWGLESAQESLFKNNIEGEMVAVPFPRDPQADKHYIAGDTLGFMVPAGAQNIQGGVQWILSSRIYETDPDVVAQTRADMMDANQRYYPKCPECKFNCEEDGINYSATCPECNAQRKPKFKAVYTEEQMQILEDMNNPQKMGLIFDSLVGFNTDFTNIFVNSETAMLDGALYGDVTFVNELEANYNTVEAYLESYRSALRNENVSQ